MPLHLVEWFTSPQVTAAALFERTNLKIAQAFDFAIVARYTRFVGFVIGILIHSKFAVIYHWKQGLLTSLPLFQLRSCWLFSAKHQGSCDSRDAKSWAVPWRHDERGYPAMAETYAILAFVLCPSYWPYASAISFWWITARHKTHAIGENDMDEQI